MSAVHAAVTGVVAGAVPAANARASARRAPSGRALAKSSSPLIDGANLRAGRSRARLARGARTRALSPGKEGDKTDAGSGDAQAASGGECPVGFGKNGRFSAVGEAINGVKNAAYLSFMSSSTPLTKEEAAASAAAANPDDVVILENKVFLNALRQAIADPVGMPAAMLEWHRLVGHDTVGIENPIGPGCVSTIDPRTVEYICKTNAANYRDRLLPDIFRLVLKDLGVTGSQGEYNRQHRKVCQKPFINNNFLKTFSTVVEKGVGHLIESFDMASAKAGPGVGIVEDVDLHSQHLLLDIISPISFDYNFNLLDKSRTVITGEGKFEANPMLEAYHRSAEIMGQVFITPLPLLKLGAKFGIGRLQELIDAYDSLERMGDDIVKQRREMHKAQRERGEEIEQVCLLDTMLYLEDDQGNLAYTDEELWGDMNDIMAAGHQTQAATMTMSLLYVSRNPDVKAKIEEELAALGGRAPTFEDVWDGRLTYTQSVVKETLRLHPPIHMFPRLATDADVMPSGHKVEPGDLVLLSTWAMGRNPKVWEEPTKFDPERFTDERLEKLAREQNPGADDDEIERAVTMLKSGRDFIYTPFGAGPRSCIGGLFSLLTVTTIIASCIQRYDFEPDDDFLPADGEIPLRYDVTMCFPKGLKMKLTKRDVEGSRVQTPPAVASAR